MNADYVSLETAKKLKDKGYPQDQWPQMVWSLMETEPRLFWLTYNGYSERLSVQLIAAPTILRALQWVEQRTHFSEDMGSDVTTLLDDPQAFLEYVLKAM